jgi:hypothetical protein
MDQGMDYFNGPVLPLGLNFNTSSTIGQKAAQWKDPTGGLVVAWRQQGWFVNMYEISKVETKAEKDEGAAAVPATIEADGNSNTNGGATNGVSGAGAGGAGAGGAGAGAGAGTIHWTDSDNMPQGGWQGGRGWQLGYGWPRQNKSDGTIFGAPPFYIEVRSVCRCCYCCAFTTENHFSFSSFRFDLLRIFSRSLTRLQNGTSTKRPSSSTYGTTAAATNHHLQI